MKKAVPLLPKKETRKRSSLYHHACFICHTDKLLNLPRTMHSTPRAVHVAQKIQRLSKNVVRVSYSHLTTRRKVINGVERKKI